MLPLYHCTSTSGLNRIATEERQSSANSTNSKQSPSHDTLATLALLHPPLTTPSPTPSIHSLASSSCSSSSSSSSPSTSSPPSPVAHPITQMSELYHHHPISPAHQLTITPNNSAQTTPFNSLPPSPSSHSSSHFFSTPPTAASSTASPLNIPSLAPLHIDETKQPHPKPIINSHQNRNIITDPIEPVWHGDVDNRRYGLDHGDGAAWDVHSEGERDQDQDKQMRKSISSKPQSFPPMESVASNVPIPIAIPDSDQEDEGVGFHIRSLPPHDENKSPDDKEKTSFAPARSSGPSVRELAARAKEAAIQAALTAEQEKLDAQNQKETAEEHKLLNLLCCIYRCRECVPTWKDREEQGLGIETYEFSHRKLGEPCCIGSALSAAFPSSLPLDLLPLTQGYLLSQPSRSFLTHPAPPSAGVIQCFIFKTEKRFELFLEMRDVTEFQNVKKRMRERAEKDVADMNESEPARKEKEREKEKERSELLEKLFRERNSWRKLMSKNGAKSGGPPGTPVSSSQPPPPSPRSAGKGSNTQRSLEDRMKENNQKSMLLANAESLIMRGEDLFLMSATRKRALTGNHYVISMGRGDGNGGGKDGVGYLGKVKSNFGGTEFVIHDCGVKSGKKRSSAVTPLSTPTLSNSHSPSGSLPSSPSHSSSSSHSQAQPIGSKYSRECGVISYDHFFEHTGSPIRIRIFLPNRSFYTTDTSMVRGGIVKQERKEREEREQRESSREKKETSLHNTNSSANNNHGHGGNAENAPVGSLSPSERSSNSNNSKTVKDMENVEEYDFQTPGLQIEPFENLRPVWHDGMNAYVLHFDNHRVREKSVKNFKLVRSGDEEKRTVLQFGRVQDRNVFVMDFSWPLSAFQAFAICLSSIDPKIAV